MLDLDGTTVLNRADALPSQKVIDAIRKAQKKLSVCIATGRPLPLAEPILDILQISHPVILLGGSQIFDPRSRKFIYEQPIKKEDYASLFSLLSQYHTSLMIDEKERSLAYTSSYKDVAFNLLVKNISASVADEIIDQISHIPTITAHKIVSWDPGFFCLNISHVKATKQHAILEVAKQLDIETHEIIGVGDGPNDFPLLMACGLKIAMGNAVSDLKAIADYIAPSVEKNGVVDIIEKFVLH